MNNILPFYISAADITMYSNIAFFVIIGLIVIGFLVGLAKGVWKKTFSLVCTIGLALTLVLCIKPLSNFIYNYDVSSIVQNFSLELPEGSGDFKTLGELLQNLINHYLESSEVQIEMTPDMIQFVDGLAHSIIQLAAFIVGAILIILILLLICPLLYHLLFKWIVPKNTRDHHKIRFLGGVEGLVEITCILSLVLMPFTGLANSILSGVRDEKGDIQVNEENTNEIYQLVCDILNGYNESILANSLFKITLDGKPIDVTLMNYITESNLNDTTKLELFDELKILSSVAFDALSKELVDFTAQTINLNVILQSEFVTDSLHKLADSSLICSALPVALLVGLNISGDMMEVDFSNVDLSNIDWSSSLSGIGDAFHEIQRSGIISEEVINSPELIMDNVILNREHETELKNALNIVFNSSFVDELMPQIAVSILDSRRETPKSDVSIKRSQNDETQSSDETKDNGNRFLDFSADLPEEAYDVETYKSIDWGKELCDMLEITLRIAEQFTLVYGEEISLSKIEKLFDQKILMNSLFGIDDEIVYETEDDYKNNIYLNGGEINNTYIYGTKRIVGCTNEEDNVGLLDLQFIKKVIVDFNLLPEIIPDIVESLEGKEQIGDINEACDRLTSEISKWKIKDWKDEFTSLLEASVPLINSTKFINEDNLQTLRDFSSGEGNFALVYFSDRIESSFLLNEVAPLLLQAFSTNPENDMELALGLRLSDLNFTKFENSSFAKEINSMAKDVLPNSESVINLVEEKNVDIKKIIHEREGLEESLEAIYSNQITNPHLTKEEISKNELSNFENVMIKLLCNPTEEDIANGVDTSLNIPTMTDNLVCVEKNTILKVGKGNNRNWVEEDGNGEIHYLFDTLESLEAKQEGDTEYILSYINGDESINMEEKVYEMGNEVERIFATVDNSVLMKDAFPSTLNKVLKDNDVGKFADFNKVDNWEKEGVYFSATLDKVNELKKSDSKSDLVTILKNCDKDLLREYQFVSSTNQDIYTQYQGEYYRYFEANSNSYELLQSLHKTQSIDLPTVLYDTVKDILTSTEDGNEQIVTDKNIKMAENDFKFEKTNKPNPKYNEELFVNWDYENKTPEYRGEIYNIARLFVYSNSLDDISNIESEEEYDEILNVVNLSYPIRNIIGDMIQTSLKKVSDSSTSKTVQDILSGVDYNTFDRLKFDCLENEKITNRLEEIETRRIEIDALCALDSRREDFERINKDNFDTEVIELTKIDNEAKESKLVDLLTKLHQSELFNSSVYISSTENGKRNKLTSFENTFNAIFNMKKDIFETVPDSKIYSLNNRGTNDKWIGEHGEIVNFNNAIYDSINSKLYKEIISVESDGKLEKIKDLYRTDNPKYLEELSTSLEKSIMMEYQLPKIYDEYIYSELKNNSPANNTIDRQYILVDTPYRSFYNNEKTIDWCNEGSAADDLFKAIATSNIHYDNPSSVKSEEIDSFFGAIEQSYVLAYKSKMDHLSQDKMERSFYEYNISVFDSYIKDEIFDNNIFEVENPKVAKGYTDTLDIVDYKKEKDFVIRFIECYEQLNGDRPYDNLGNKYNFLEASEGKKMEELSKLEEGQVDGLANILDNMNDVLYTSTVFNFRTLNATNDYIKEQYLNRCVYEYSIIHLSNQIRNALVDNFEFTTEKGYDIDKTTSNSLKSLDLFVIEQEALINIVQSYGHVLDIFKEVISIDAVAGKLEDIKDIYDNVSKSQILNHTNYAIDKKSNKLSIYDDMVLYLVNRINEKVYSSISIEDKYISIDEVKRNSILSSQTIYNSEVDTILDKGGIIDTINKMGLEDNQVNFDIDYVNNPTNRTNLISLLDCFERSYAFNYTRGGLDGYHGRNVDNNITTSSFEDICIKIFNQDSFAGKIYDKDNMMQNKILKNLNSDLTDKAVVKSKVMSINDHNASDSYIEGIEFLKDNTGEINKLFDLFGNISNHQNLEFNSIDESKEVLKEIGKIYILHDIEPKLIRDISLDQSIVTDTSESTIKKLSDVTVYRKPSFYFYEYVEETNENVVSYAYKCENKKVN